MKHVVIVNPKAGKSDVTEQARVLMADYEGKADCELYVTSAPYDAAEYVRRLCEEHPGEMYRFYACGGDGTLNEVVSGAVGHDNAEVGCLPMGSGNDYVKYYGGRERFLSPLSQLEGKVCPVDVMRVNDRYALNICNFGFDAVVCRTMGKVRRKPVIGGRNAYTTGIVKALFSGMRTRCRIAVDGKVVNDGDILLCTLGNGRYVGGAYQCSPLSINDDGLIEVCFFKPMSVLTFARLIGSYRDGTFIHRADVRDRMVYMRGRVVDIESPEPIDLCVDGEILNGSRFHVEQMFQAVRFVVPREN